MFAILIIKIISPCILFGCKTTFCYQENVHLKHFYVCTIDKMRKIKHFTKHVIVNDYKYSWKFVLQNKPNLSYFCTKSTIVFILFMRNGADAVIFGTWCSSLHKKVSRFSFCKMRVTIKVFLNRKKNF